MRRGLYEIRKRVAEAMPRQVIDIVAGISSIKYRLKLEKEKFLRRDIGDTTRSIINSSDTTVRNIDNSVIEGGICESKDPSIFRMYLSRKQDLIALDSLSAKPELFPTNMVEKIESSKRLAVEKTLDRNKRARERNWKDKKFQNESYTPYYWKTVSDEKFNPFDEVEEATKERTDKDRVLQIQKAIERKNHPSPVDIENEKLKTNHLLPLRVGELVPIKRDSNSNEIDLIILFSE